ncbi:MAG: tRNA guanosine(34) transglycosylase Tgt [Phycisphaerales bacterium]|jgi:queuine tRNA-ribosyltransferase
MAVRLEILARCSTNRARLGRLHTPHGVVDTPAFMPVATAGSIKGVWPEQVRAIGAGMILGNAYHLLLRPGSKRVAAMGGLHRFMRWDGPILTDSGGYQAFSMAALLKIDEEGFTFRSIIDGSAIRLGPAECMGVQNDLGADVIMPLDDCPPAGADSARLEVALERTHRWLEACVRHHARPAEQALFGIVQGGVDPAFRERSVAAVTAHDLPGYAIGGVAVGEGPEEIHRTVSIVAPMLPDSKPRYLMGVGYERDLVAAVSAGVDMFDCVLPTRNGRNARVFTRRGPLNLRNAIHAEVSAPIEEGCDCPGCAGGFSRAYLRHLFMAGEMLGPIIASVHNLRHYQRLMLDIRQAIQQDAWSSLESAWPVLEGVPSPSRTP